MINKNDIFEQLIFSCAHIYHSSDIAKPAREYLSKRLSKNAQDDYEFGYFPDDENIDILFSFVDKKLLEEAGLIKDHYVSYSLKSSGYFKKHNLILPFRDDKGHIISVLGRCLLSEEERAEQKLQKYIYTKDSKKSQYVYGLDKAKKHIIEKNYVICVEGQFDCISMHENGFFNTVALGWANMSILQLYQVARYTKNIVMLLDNDEAGQKGNFKVKQLYGDSFNFYDITFDSYKDADDLLRKGSLEQISCFRSKFNGLEQISKKHI